MIAGVRVPAFIMPLLRIVARFLMTAASKIGGTSSDL